ncbi:MAG TPA: hypothetical protein VK426_04870 [Methanobacterium sp.]|nr:hypothetical protein [Methanobacterium sp.]
MSQDSDENKDDSINFRRCWALGESYYYLENNYNDCFKCDSGKMPEPKVIRDYKSNLLAIETILKELGIEDNGVIQELQGKLDDISKENNSSEDICQEFDSIGDFFEVKLEGYIIGNLMGKDPRYNHIFRTSKHCQGLYGTCKDDEELNYIRTDLESIKNFVSKDRVTLVHEILNNWPKVRERYKTKTIKDLNFTNIDSNDKNNPLNSNYEEYKPSYLKEIVNRIEGLIIGSVKVRDILIKRDYAVLTVVSFLPLLIPGVLILIVVLGVKLDYSSFNKFIPLIKVENINSYLLALTAFIGALLAVVKSLNPVWQRFTDWAMLKLAIRRLKDPGQYLILLPWEILEKEKLQKIMKLD